MKTRIRKHALSRVSASARAQAYEKTFRPYPRNHPWFSGYGVDPSYVIEPARFGGGLPRGTALGDVEIGSRQDPIATFGRRAAQALIAVSRTLPSVAERKEMVKLALDGIGPGLWTKVSEKARTLQTQRGYSAATALDRALTIQFSNTMLGELQTMSKTGRVPLGGLIELGCCAGAVPMGSFWGKVKGGLKATGRGLKTAAKATGKAVETYYKAVGKLACAAVDTGLVDEAIVAGGAAFAVPIPPQGAKAAASGAKRICDAARGRKAPAKPKTPITRDQRPVTVPSTAATVAAAQPEAPAAAGGGGGAAVGIGLAAAAALLLL